MGLRRLVREVETRQMIREAAAGMAAVRMNEDQFSWAHVQARRIWARFPDRRSLTGRIMGDPILERSALGYSLFGWPA